MFYDMFARARMNADLAEQERGTFPSRADRTALCQAKRVEREFRKSRGYEPDTFWYRLLKKLGFRHTR